MEKPIDQVAAEEVVEELVNVQPEDTSTENPGPSEQQVSLLDSLILFEKYCPFRPRKYNTTKPRFLPN